MESTPTLEALEARFLKPDRSRLEAIRALARQHRDVPALIEALGADAPARDDRRYFRMSRSEALRIGPTRLLYAREANQRALLDRPPSLESAALFFSDPGALVEAEAAARRFAAALWAAEEALGIQSSEPQPPLDIVWSLNGSGSTPSSYDRFDLHVFDRLSALFEPLGSQPSAFRTRNPSGELTGAFAAVAELIDYQQRWLSAQREGVIPERAGDPVAAFLAIWMTGLGISDFQEGTLLLFAPERADTPTRRAQAQRPRGRSQQRRLEMGLLGACGNPRSLPRDIEQHLAWGADPNARVYRGVYPPLSALVRAGPGDLEISLFVEKVRLLLKAGANPGKSDLYGASPLVFWLSDEKRSAETLLAAGLPPDAADDLGKTALHCAVHTPIPHDKRPGLVKRLIAAGVPVDAADHEGMTALHRALLHNVPSLVDVLLDAGASPRLLTSDGRTVYHLAATGLSGDPERLKQVIERFAALGAPNMPDGHGWLPQIPEALAESLKMPPPAPRIREDFGTIKSAKARIPEGMVLAMHRGEAHAWEVVSDWLQQEDDIRGDLIALSLAEQEDRAPHGSYDLALARCKHILSAPLAEAHPIGGLLDRVPGAMLSYRRGLLWSAFLPIQPLLPALPALLRTEAAATLRELYLTVGPEGSLEDVLPERLPIAQLWLTLSTERRMSMSSEALPHLTSLVLRGPLGASVLLPNDLCARLETLRLEQPYTPEKPWVPLAHIGDLSSLRSLQIVASRAPRRDDPGMPWLVSALERLDSADHLELRPVSVDLFEAIVDLPLFGRLRSLVLSSAHAALLPVLEVYSGRLASIERLEIKTVGMQRAARATAQQQLRARLPRVVISGIEYRKDGQY